MNHKRVKHKNLSLNPTPYHHSSTYIRTTPQAPQIHYLKEIPSSSSSSKFPRLLGSVRHLSIISERKPFLSAGKPKLSDDFTWITSNTYSSRRAAF
ncbi:hypothetical protein AOXY_G19394 [Acipenser oxyrinchus oxyrinchus]|uniref:Uncharacterized protein n=1 Tax=Acipenser oxyrinchus oxyrinchus TaxID=40147 RepID=A0AAD8G1L0_ACIOX|nr:hypothetical protein AOXY_G19394 [Acipenser oxyrinchus oxyrinchus]